MPGRIVEGLGQRPLLTTLERRRLQLSRSTITDQFNLVGYDPDSCLEDLSSTSPRLMGRVRYLTR
jgi:hypothetical protein